jgi:hypothetical protein
LEVPSHDHYGIGLPPLPNALFPALFEVLSLARLEERRRVGSLQISSFQDLDDAKLVEVRLALAAAAAQQPVHIDVW